MMQKRIHLQKLQDERRQFEEKIDKITENIGQCGERIVKYQDEVVLRQSRRVDKTTLTAELAEHLKEEFSVCEKEYLRQTEGAELEKFRENYIRARKANWTLKEKAEDEMAAAMRAYKVAHDFE